MDRLDERRPAAAAPSASGAANYMKAPTFSKFNTFHHHRHPSLVSPAKENPKNGSGGAPPMATAAVKPVGKLLYEEDHYRGAPTVRRLSSFASKSSRAAARWGTAPGQPKDRAAAPKVVFYSTSLRGIRRTFEDCCAVRNILRGFRVAVDERDLSMDASLRRELQSRLGGKSPVTLPQVFIGERWVGGAEEIRQIHEGGELGKLLEGVPRQDPRFVCRACGGMRFLPCSACSGSRKVFDEGIGQLRRCPDCNENGLVRCSNCC